MRACCSAVVVVVLSAACSRPTPASQAEQAVKDLYRAPLGDRDAERDAFRKHASERQQGVLAALDAHCSDILKSDAPNHGLTGPAVADFNAKCLEGLPLSCGRGRALDRVDAVVTGDRAAANAVVGGAAVEVALVVEGGAWKVDDVRCP